MTSSYSFVHQESDYYMNVFGEGNVRDFEEITRFLLDFNTAPIPAQGDTARYVR